MIIPIVIKRLQSVRILVIILINIAFSVKADHYYGGYITYEHIGGYTYKVTVITYADNSKENSDRDSVEVIWGDGEKEFIQRVNNIGNGETVFPGIKKNIYEGTHKYSDFGNYQLVFIDDFRPFDIFNIEAGKSGTTLLYIDAIVPVEDSLTFCKNNAPRLLTEPFMFGRSGEDFALSLTHYDIDGDSLVFKLTEPKARNAFSVPGYYYPNDVFIDSKTGLFTWENPPFGNYVFAYEIEEYREGQLIGVSVADFPVFLKSEYNSKGIFSEVLAPIEYNHYHFDGPEVIDLIIDYENTDADSVFIEVVTGLEYSSHFRLTNSSFSTGTKAFDTLEVNYYGEDNSHGNHIVTFRAGNIYGSDTLFDYHSVSLSTTLDTTWNCTIPPNIKDVVEIPPIVDLFSITPNLFTESVWINLGENYENMSVEVFDMRGRSVVRENNPESETFKMHLHTLRPAMYFFVINRDNQILTVLKSVKK